jgi:hypothetical protein
LGKAYEGYEIPKWYQGIEAYPECRQPESGQMVRGHIICGTPRLQSHNGAMMTLGKGAMQSIVRKQKMNMRSSTEGKLVTVNNAATMILWTKLFLEGQGYDVDKNIVYQDNKSTILLETNGKKSSGKQTRALNICYFFITNQVEKGNAQIEHCKTNNMVGDFFTKPLQGEKFQRFRNNILGR